MNASVGFVGFGEINTDRAVIERKCGQAVRRLEAVASRVYAAGPVNDAPGYRQADEAVEQLKRAEFDVLVVCVAGWIPTHAVIRAIDPFRHLPMLLWGLCGWMEGDSLVSTADQAGSTALRYAMQEMGYRFHYVTSPLGGPEPMDDIEAYLDACHAAGALRGARIGTMGYRDMLLYGTMFDGLSLRRQVGVEIEPFETLEMYLRANALTDAEIAPAMKLARREFVFTEPCEDAVLEPSARYATAIAERIRACDYQCISLIDVDGMKKLLNLPPSFIFNLVDLMTGACTIPENDMLGSVTQLMVKLATGQGAPYAEFYEFFEDGFLMGVPDFIPRSCTLGDAVIRPSKFGLLTTSLLNVSKYRDGEVTLCRLVTVNGQYRMHLLTGTAKQPRKWEESGWAPPAPQLPSLEVSPDCSMDEFRRKVSSQHIIVAYGDQTAVIRHLCGVLGIEML